MKICYTEVLGKMINCRLNFWLYLNCIILHKLASATVDALRFDVTGYQRCVFNVVFSDRKLNTIEKILVSNPQIQSWRIFASPPAAHTKDIRFLRVHVPRDLKEVCSINLLINVFGGCSGQNILLIFGSRLYNPNNFLYLIHGKASGCSGKPEEIAEGLFGRIAVNPIVLKLTEDSLDVETAEIYCISCTTTDHIFVQLPVPYGDLLKVADYTRFLISWYFVPIVAGISQVAGMLSTIKEIRQCGFLYKMGQWTNSWMIGCEPEHLLIENAATKLNYSVEYFHPSWFSVMSINRPRRVHAVISVVGVANWQIWSWYVPPEGLIQQLLMGQKAFLFQYCVRMETRKGFSFFFWVIPFENASWVFIGISVVTLIGILRGNWFEIYAILMRQECRILKGKHKLLVVFIFATIVFTYGYEGVISSFLTVAPPVVVYNKLKDLFDKGYKILQPENIVLDSFIELFKTENISWDKDPEVLFEQIPYGAQNEYFRLKIMGTCKFLDYVLSESVDQWKVRLKEHHPNISCNFVKEVTFCDNIVSHIFGISQRKYALALESLVRSGVWKFYSDYYRYLHYLHYKRKSELMEYEDKRITPFTMADWKILSIFIVWAVLLGATSAVLLFELVVRVWKLKSQTKIIRIMSE